MSLKNLIPFFALAYFISWLIWLPLYMPHFDVHGLPVLPFHHAFGALGPMIAAFIITYYERRTKGLKDLAMAMMKANSAVLLLVAFVAPFVLLLIAATIDSYQSHTPLNLSMIGRTKEFPHFNFLSFFLYSLLFFGFGEETGWKGYALPKLQTRYSALTSAIIFTFFWAIWHVPLFFYRPGYTSMGMAGMAGWFFSLLTGSILLTWLFNASKGSILVCAVFHATIDMVFISDFVGSNTITYLGILVTIWGILMIPVLIAKNKRRVDNGPKDNIRGQHYVK
ncbi:MAG: CPBP family intramembrane metalloprotease [Flavisolibacter sp.]|nr:CPBP family intramembrane metalloprotease [Flavisolibacter sp.]